MQKTLPVNKAPQISLTEDKKLTNMLNCQTALALGAHPDDLEIGCGGTLARLSNGGATIQGRTFSAGQNGCFNCKKEDRIKEALRGANILGYNLKLYDFVDTTFSKNLVKIANIVEEQVNKIKPDVIFVHCMHDIHQDHRTLHEATLIATRNTPCSILCYENGRTQPDFRPHIFVNIKEVLEKKLDALSAHQTQLGKGGVELERVITLARYRGSEGRIEFAEAFQLLRGTVP